MTMTNFCPPVCLSAYGPFRHLLSFIHSSLACTTMSA